MEGTPQVVDFLVDQNIEILNQIAANSPKVEAILATITNILNEMPDCRSIAGAANRVRQNGDGVSYEARLAAKGLGEHVELGLELASQPHIPKPDFKTIEASDAGEVPSPIRHPARTQNTPTGSQELVTVASLREKNLGSIQNCKEVNHCVQQSSSVPERPITKYDRDRLFEEVWKTPMRTLARQYGVSDTALRQACRRLAVPTPPRGYWNKGAAARQIFPRPELPQTPIPDRKHNCVYSEEERDSILTQIRRAISNGKTLSAACRDAGIMEKTFRRWYRSKSASVAFDALAAELATSKADQTCSNSGKMGPRSQNFVSGSRPQGSPDADGTGSNTSTNNLPQTCEEAEQRPSREIEQDAASNPAAQMPCESRSIPRVSAKLLRIHDRERLYREIWSKTMAEVAKEYGVSTPTIGRRCSQLHIPVPPLGHWLRLETGLPVQQRPTLPEIQIIEEETKVWKSNGYSSDEIIRISERISDVVLAGKKQEDACREAGIAITTYRRWRKQLPQPADSLAPAPRPSLVCGNNGMKKRGFHHRAEEIADLYREIEAALQSGKPLHIALREAKISQSTYYRWQK